MGPTLPWGIHLAYGSDNVHSMTVMWSTRAAVASSVAAVFLGSTPVANFSGEAIPFQSGNNTQTMHRVLLSGLQAGTTYSYSVGDGAAAMSPVLNFTTQPEDASSWSPRVAIYGDMGISTNAQETMPWLLAEAQAGTIDAVLHIG